MNILDQIFGTLGFFSVFCSQIITTNHINMQENVIERLRQTVINDLFNTHTVDQCWVHWKPLIQQFIGSTPNAQSVLDLGEHLREIFQSSSDSNVRSQSDVSAGGTAWEALITWYVNLCCVGSRVVAVKKMGQVPTPIKDAIAVNYSNFSCTTESDITVIVFPNDPIFTNPNITLLNKKYGVDNDKLSEAVASSFKDFEIGIIQCKTNWNDNAQIPMLWDMIYSAGGFRGRQISVGRNNFSIQQLGNGFTYSFVTVPSVKLNNFKNTSLAVKRVYNLSGGNYWGLETKDGVARCVKEIFNNYRNGYEQSDIRRTLSDAIPILQSELNYFRIY